MANKNIQENKSLKKRPFGDLFLSEYSGEHIAYEVDMFFWLAKVLTGQSQSMHESSLNSVRFNNVLIESFGIHLRNLIFFFYQEKPQETDVIAEDYCEPGAWKQKRPQSSDDLKKARDRASKELAHLTASRLDGSPPEKKWEVLAITNEISQLLGIFCENAKSDLLSPNLIEVIKKYSLSSGKSGQTTMQHSDRYRKGWEKLKEIDGEAGERVIESLKDVSPDLGTYIIEYAFGDIYTRPGLDLKSKEIAVVAALTAMGTAQPQLKVHINGALNTGSTINEVKEVILQMSVYSGFPSCINAMNALKDVLNERQARGIKDETGKAPTAPDRSDRLKTGEKELSKLDAAQVERLRAAYDDFSPELVRFVLEYGYADIFARDNLDVKHRQIATIAALAALGNAAPQLKFHINAGLNIGLTAENIQEIMLLMSVYAGFPAAINGTNVVKEVLGERKGK